MNVGVIGLGRMGSAIVYRLAQAGHTVYGFDLTTSAQEEAKKDGAYIAASLDELAQKVTVFWLMLPAGKAVDEIIKELLVYIKPGTTVVDGGNSHFPDSVRRYRALKEQDISFLDCGTSGGLQGKELGFSLMIGGDKEVFKKCKPLFAALAIRDGYAYLGPAGAGHYVKMVHNGIEYALLQSYAEGLHLLHDGRYKDLNLEHVTRVWSHGSIIRSYITELAYEVYKKDQNFKDVKGTIGGGSTGRWTIEEAHAQNVSVKLIEDSLQIRDESQKSGGNYATKLVALLRNQFGGHSFEKI